MKILSLVTDSFGGRGGIAQFNRDLLTSLAANPVVEVVVAVPRLIVDDGVPIPAGLDYRRAAAGAKLRYVWHALAAASERTFDLVICGHINLLPLAALIARRQRCPIVLVLYGIDAWRPPRSAIARRAVRRVDHVVSISQFTLERFLSWSKVDRAKVSVIPCCVNLDEFTPAPKRHELTERYGLAGRTVLLTVARLAMTEQYKGIDEVLNVLPSLARVVPNLSYLIIGEGPDRSRLEAKARALGVADRVVFAGYVVPEEKRDHYALADVFVMPGRAEGFGIVYLEALACGIPVIASAVDASRETVRDGELGAIVNPDRPEELIHAIREALSHPKSTAREALSYFSFPAFRDRWHALLQRVGAAAHRDGGTAVMST